MTLKELENDVEQLATECLTTMSVNPSKYVYCKIRVLFEDSNGRLLEEASEFDSMEIPEFVLQDTVFGDGFNEMLAQKRAECLSANVIQSFGLPKDCRIAGVMVSTEVIFATKTTFGKEKRVKGWPYLLISGQTKNGERKTILRPLAINDEELKFSINLKDIPENSKVKETIQSIESAPGFLGEIFKHRSNQPIGKGMTIFNLAS